MGSQAGSWAPKVLHLSSSNARFIPNSLMMSSATFQLNKPITVPQNYQMFISCISAVIPFSFWSISTAIVIPFTYGVSNTARNLTIPSGNQSASQVATALTDVTSGLTVSYSAATGVFTFSAGATNSITFPAQAVNSLIGVSTSGLTIATNGQSQAIGVPQIAGPRAVEVNTSIPLDTTTAGSGTAQTLCYIPVDTNPNNYIVYKPYNWVKQIAKTNNFQEITVSLCDENGAALDMKGANWSVDICLELCTPPDMVNKDFTEMPAGGDLFSAAARSTAQSKKFINL